MGGMVVMVVLLLFIFVILIVLIKFLLGLLVVKGVFWVWEGVEVKFVNVVSFIGLWKVVLVVWGIVVIVVLLKNFVVLMVLMVGMGD